MTTDDKEDRSPYITITQGGAGWFAVHMWWHPDGFWEPYQTGIGRYHTREEAIVEAAMWAAAEEMRYVPG